MVQALTADQRGQAAQLLAQAFVANPLHVAVLGPNALARNEIFFRVALTTLAGDQHVAVEGDRIVGFVHWVSAPRCQASTASKIRLLPVLLRALGVVTTVQVVRWLSVWARYDPRESHVHLGPIGVAPAARGRGVGRELMELFCRDVDHARAVAYLETDRKENVAFYSKFGFRVTDQAQVCGVTNYFMRREQSSRLA
jgi:ribosomal protein S18 acetylase RimI-like enzyme